jgi:hypothetical protein
MPHLSTAAYIAQFTPAAPAPPAPPAVSPVVPEVIHITDDEEEEPMEVEASSATTSDGPASTPVAVPIPLVDAPVPAATPPPASQAVSAPTPVSTPAAPEEPEEMGWTTRNKFKKASEDAHYHNLLTTMLAEHYLDLAASVKYYCAEHQHPVEATYWKTNVIITAWNNTMVDHLGQPTMYKKKPRVFTMVDRTP